MRCQKERVSARAPKTPAVCLCGFGSAGCLGRSLASTKCVSDKYLRQVEATEVSTKANEVGARQTAEGITILERSNSW